MGPDPPKCMRDPSLSRLDINNNSNPEGNSLSKIPKGKANMDFILSNFTKTISSTDPYSLHSATDEAHTVIPGRAIQQGGPTNYSKLRRDMLQYITRCFPTFRHIYYTVNYKVNSNINSTTQWDNTSKVSR